MFNDTERSVTVSKYDVMLLIINKEIENRGIERGQENSTEFGRKILSLFDEIHDSMRWQYPDGTIENSPFVKFVHPFDQISLSISSAKDDSNHPPVRYDNNGNIIYGNYKIVDRESLEKK